MYCDYITFPASINANVTITVELSDVYIAPCHSELANNSERPIWFPLYATSVIAKIERKLFLKNTDCLLNRHLGTEVIRWELNGKGRVTNTAGKQCL